MPTRRAPTSASSSSYAHLSKADRAAYMARPTGISDRPLYSTLPIQDQVQPVIPARVQPVIPSSETLPEPLPVVDAIPLSESVAAPFSELISAPAIAAVAAPLLAPMTSLTLTPPPSSPRLSAIPSQPILDEPAISAPSVVAPPNSASDPEFLEYQRFLAFKADRDQHARVLRYAEQEKLAVAASSLPFERASSPHSSDTSFDSRKRTRSPPMSEPFVSWAPDSDTDSDTTAPPFLSVRGVPHTNSTTAISAPTPIAPRPSRSAPRLKPYSVAPSPAEPSPLPTAPPPSTTRVFDVEPISPFLQLPPLLLPSPLWLQHRPHRFSPHLFPPPWFSPQLLPLPHPPPRLPFPLFLQKGGSHRPGRLPFRRVLFH